MDAVLFEVKKAHLVGARFARRALSGFEMTPARFDLMNAVGARGARQSDLWRQLQVVRSVVCEMLSALEEVGWVVRKRDRTDGRTSRVSWTERGREVFERAYARCVESGDVGVHIDAVLVNRLLEYDPEPRRVELMLGLRMLIREFGWRGRRAPDLYLWDPEDYYDWLVDTELPPEMWGFPVAGQESRERESSSERS